MIREMLVNILKNKKVVLFVLFVFTLFLSLLLVIFNKNNDNLDTIKYNGKNYVCLEYNLDVFTYGFNSNQYFEVDEISQVFHEKWDMIYFDGDLFVAEEQALDAISYYASDDNYEWFFVFDDGDSEVVYPISFSDEELKFLYNVDSMERNETMLFDEIKNFGSIKKVSKDESVYALISLAYYKDSWYWKSEIIDVNQEGDPEYVVRLPDSINEKISNVFNKK